MEIRVIGRDIQIDSSAAIAIENDNETETLNFILDNYTESGVDLSTLYGFMVYANKLGTRTEILDMQRIGDKLHASWTVTRSLTTINGRFLFCLTFISAQDYERLSKSEKVWSTNIAKSNITGSLVGDDYAVPEEPIILKMQQIAAQVAAIERDSKENAEKAEEAASRAEDNAEIVEQKVLEVQVIIDSLGQTIDVINGEVI